MKYRLILISALFFSPGGHGAQYSDADVKLVEQNFPKSILPDKDDDGRVLTVGNGLGYHFEEVKLDTSGSRYFATLYQAAISSREMECQLVVLKVDNKNKVQSFVASLNNHDELANCGDMSFKDLDGDGKPEVLVDTNDINSGAPNGSPYIFKWDGKTIKDITPFNVSGNRKITAFRSVEFVDAGKSVLILDSPATYHLHGEVMGVSNDKSFKSFALQNGSVVQTATFDYLKIFNKNTKKKKDETFVVNPTLVDGVYTLDIKNLSGHNRAVRAEVTINGSVVLKPEDFCEAKPPKKTDKDAWKGNDDDDDRDEDRCKRCKAKSEVYAIVNIKTANEIKVKMYGRKDSVLQLSLVKK